MNNLIIARFLILFTLVITNLRFINLNNKKEDALSMVSILSVVFSILSVISFGNNFIEMGFFGVSLFTFIVNLKPMYRYIRHLRVDYDTVVFTIFSLLCFFMTVALFVLMMIFNPMNYSQKISHVKESVIFYNGNMEEGFSVNDKALHEKSYKVVYFENVEKQKKEKPAKLTKEEKKALALEKKEAKLEKKDAKKAAKAQKKADRKAKKNKNIEEIDANGGESLVEDVVLEGDEIILDGGDGSLTEEKETSVNESAEPSQEIEIAQVNIPRNIVLFVPSKASSISDYVLVFNKLAKDKYFVYALDSNVPNSSILLNHSRNLKIQKPEVYKENILSQSEQIILEYEMFCKMVDYREMDNVILVIDEEIVEINSEEILEKTNIKKIVNLSEIENYSTKGFGPIENTNPIYAKKLDVKRDLKGNLSKEMTEYIENSFNDVNSIEYMN